MKKQLGYISVDSGTVLVADPCYWLKSDKEENLKENETRWGRFCEEIGSDTVHEFEHGSGFIGKGIMLGGFGGDGVYPVFAEYDKNGRQTRLIVEFGYDEEEGEE